MQKISTDKFTIFFEENCDLSKIDLPSLKFLIDDCNSLNIKNMVPEDVLIHISQSNEMSVIKYNVSLLIKYVISDISYKFNKNLRDIINNMKNASNIPFLAYFLFLYNNMVKIEKKYLRKNADELYVYLTDLYYLD